MVIQPSRVRKALVGRRQGVGRAHGPRHLARGQVDGRLPIGVHDAGLEERGVHVLAPPRIRPLEQGPENAHGGKHAGRDVGDRRPHLDRRPARPLAGDAHQAAHALGHQVEAAAIGVGPGAAVARQRTIDQPGAGFPDLVVAGPVCLHRAPAVVLDEHVGALDQPYQRRLAGVRFHVEGGAALVAVHHGEGGGFPVVDGLVAADIVAMGQALHLDHVGAHVGQQKPARRRRHDVAHLDDADARKQARGRHPTCP